MSELYKYLDEDGREWVITQEEMEEKIKYLKDNVHRENGQQYILVRYILKVVPDGHPMQAFWLEVLEEGIRKAEEELDL